MVIIKIMLFLLITYSTIFWAGKFLDYIKKLVKSKGKSKKIIRHYLFGTIIFLIFTIFDFIIVSLIIMDVDINIYLFILIISLAIFKVLSSQKFNKFQDYRIEGRFFQD